MCSKNNEAGVRILFPSSSPSPLPFFLNTDQINEFSIVKPAFRIQLCNGIMLQKILSIMDHVHEQHQYYRKIPKT